MDNNNNSQNSNKSDNKATNNDSTNNMNSKISMGDTKDYISGDSTPSSSSHQFPWIATDPKNESKKSAKKTNS